MYVYCMSVCILYVCMYVRTYVCMYVCMYVRMYVSMCVYMCICHVRDKGMEGVAGHIGTRYEEEDTCVSYGEEDTCVAGWVAHRNTL
jgi:hypothetical protein